jgi:hypothetical protein
VPEEQHPPSPNDARLRPLIAACGQVTGCRPVSEGQERILHMHLEQALSAYGPRREGRLTDHAAGWTRAPGGIDLVAESISLGIEVKVAKPEELLWDAIKLAQRVSPDAKWPKGLQAAALVVQTTGKALGQDSCYMLASEPQTYDLRKLIDARRDDWYWLMCGGRGIRPLSLPATLEAGATHTYSYASNPDVLLALRTFSAPSLESAERIPLDAHGWPLDLDPPIDDKWRHRIDQCAEQPPTRKLAHAVPNRHLPVEKSEVQIAQINLFKEEAPHRWAFAWAPGYEQPTAYRLAGDRCDEYDVRRSANGAVSAPASPQPLPDWCRDRVLRNPDRDSQAGG